MFFHSYLFNRSSSFKDGEGNGTPLQYSCLENPMDGGTWWAAVHGVTKSQTRLSDFTFTFHFHGIGEGNGNPLQCSCLENPRDGGAWWAAIYGVAQSWTRLKRRPANNNSETIIVFWPVFSLPRISSSGNTITFFFAEPFCCDCNGGNSALPRSDHVVQVTPFLR